MNKIIVWNLIGRGHLEHSRKEGGNHMDLREIDSEELN
jgi:hypothetical protein